MNKRQRKKHPSWIIRRWPWCLGINAPQHRIYFINKDAVWLAEPGEMIKPDVFTATDVFYRRVPRTLQQKRRGKKHDDYVKQESETPEPEQTRPPQS